MSMTVARATLKQHLILTRKSVLDLVPRCELCGTARASDMHEVWISRGQAQGNDALMTAILECEYNVVLLCNPCNLRRAETAMGRAFLRNKLMYLYGADVILTWVISLPFQNASTRDQFRLEVAEIRDRIADDRASSDEMKAEWAAKRTKSAARKAAKNCK
jgi:hypothetical protein